MTSTDPFGGWRIRCEPHVRERATHEFLALATNLANVTSIFHAGSLSPPRKQCPHRVSRNSRVSSEAVALVYVQLLLTTLIHLRLGPRAAGPPCHPTFSPVGDVQSCSATHVVLLQLDPPEGWSSPSSVDAAGLSSAVRCAAASAVRDPLRSEATPCRAPLPRNDGSWAAVTR